MLVQRRPKRDSPSRLSVIRTLTRSIARNLKKGRTLEDIMKNMQVFVSQELQQQLEIYSNIIGKPMPDVVEEGLRRWLATDGTKDLEKAIAAAKR